MRHGCKLCLLLAPILLAGLASADDSATPEGIDLELIMGHPDWLGRQPEEAWWAWDGQTVYYRRKREGEEVRDLWRVPVDGGEPDRVDDGSVSAAGAPGGRFNPRGSLLAFENNGDIFLRDMQSGELRQLTRSGVRETEPRFMADGRSVAWRQGDVWFVRDADTGVVSQAADVRAEKDPLDEEPEFDYLETQQRRLFETLRKIKDQEEDSRRRERELRLADPARVPPAFFLGDNVSIQQTSLSPAGDRMLVVTRAADHEDGKSDEMPNYVTRSGYVEHEQVRTLVGRRPPAAHSVWLLDLESQERHALDLTALPGIQDDPLAPQREEALEWHVERGADRDKAATALKAPETRPVRVTGIEWTSDGRRLAVQFQSVDNKDRWIATVDEGGQPAPETRHRLTDPAWINWSFNEFGWLPDNETLWYLSEESGYSHLYVRPAGGRARQLTEGDFVVSSPVPNRDGAHFYIVANRQHPGWHDVYRVSVSDGAMERITDVGIEPAARAPGSASAFVLSPDETSLVFHDGSATRPPELHAQTVGGGSPQRLTHTVSERFTSQPWNLPEFVKVPSSHVDRPIHSRLYLPEDHDPSRQWPAVVFVHGAGYLQNAHQGWSGYYREFMFHTLLNLHGYVVLDMDYRASAGYGRDWRTAIYRRMGHPELEDLLDGVDWLVENHAVDPDRIGIYGGSYGGFMTFMAMFRSPETFAAGASLRPVTDWVHYNHSYTSNILNSPLVDPMAHERSSPIEYAADYANRPLAIFHGMQDDNVFFKDTVRLVQRLIELKKENYYPMFYPLDPHTFEHPESWLDEYRRIFALFERHLK